MQVTGYSLVMTLVSMGKDWRDNLAHWKSNAQAGCVHLENKKARRKPYEGKFEGQ
jgi:hypothetical protein